MMLVSRVCIIPAYHTLDEQVAWKFELLELLKDAPKQDEGSYERFSPTVVDRCCHELQAD